MNAIKLILTIFLLHFFCQLSAQCINNVNTNPPFASNNNLPIGPYGQGGTDTADVKYLNGLSWWLAQGYPLTNMGFNSLNTYPDQMEWIHHVSQHSYYNYLKYDEVQKVMSANNGWELLHVNLGRYPDDQTVMPNNTAYMSIPYIILYNRYSGVARVFVRYGNQGNIGTMAQGVRIDLMYSYTGSSQSTNKVSGIFRLAEGLDVALDQESRVMKQTAVTRNNGAVAFWMSADFQLTYDPCVCYYPGYIDAQFSFFKTSNLRLHGRQITTEENLVSGSNVLTNDFLGSFDATTSTKDGFIIYRQMEAMIDDYLVRLNEYEAKLAQVNKHNEKVKTNKMILIAAKLLFSSGPGALVGSPLLFVLIGKIPTIKPWYDGGDPSDEKVKKARADFAKAVDKSLWEVGELLFKESLTTKPNPTKPTQPTAAFSEMYFNGHIVDSADVKSPTIRTPGSLNSHEFLNQGTLKQSYPVYNEALGVFALLKSPKITYTKTSVSNPLPNWVDSSQQLLPSWLDYYQFHLSENLAYFLNPKLDIVSSEKMISLQIVAHRSNAPAMHNNNTTQSNVFFDPQYTVNLNTLELPEYEYYPIYNNNSIPHFFTQSGIHGDSTPVNIELGSVVFNSPFIPINAINLTKFQLGFRHQIAGNLAGNPYSPQPNSDDFSHVFNFDIYVKIAAKIKYSTLNDDNEVNEFDYLFTYKVLDDDIELIDVTPEPQVIWVNGPYDILQYQENLVFGDTHFDGSAIEGCSLSQNTYNCVAINDIEINGNISVANGYFVSMRAGNTIIVEPESEISPESELIIEPIYDYSLPMPMYDEIMVKSFCEDTSKYRALVTQRSVQQYLDSIAQTNPPLEEVQQQKSPIEFIVFPNPTTGASQAGLNLPELATVSIIIVDITGKVQGRPVQNQVLPMGRNVLNLESEPLAPGVYFVQVVLNGEKLTQRLVKQ